MIQHLAFTLKFASVGYC